MALQFPFDNTWVRELPGTFTAWSPAAVAAPQLVYANRDLAAELGLDADAMAGAGAAAVFSGHTLPDGAQPIAQAYAGHQFGGFSPSLGDGRALLLGEVVDVHGRRRDIAFKGSGRTPYSRSGDGKAALGPMLREVLIGEAMHALGIPTTRALAVATTGEPVYRERALPGAVLTRVAASHLRVGTFQYFAARGDTDTLRRLVTYALKRHHPVAVDRRNDGPEAWLALLQAVAEVQARLIAQWMNVGFIHGVMNTDNMTISGETIDYGPCAFMEATSPQAVFSSIDHGGRYAWGNQPHIARWNLARLAEALLPLAADADDEPAVQRAVTAATAVIDAFPAQYAAALLAGQRAKLGLAHATAADDDEDRSLAEAWLALLEAQAVDFTLGWRRLADATAGHRGPLDALFAEPAAIDAWLVRWQARCARDDSAGDRDPAERPQRLRAVNPLVIPRNHRVEQALDAASERGDVGPFDALLAAARRPFDTPADPADAEPAPREVTARYQTFCGT